MATKIPSSVPRKISRFFKRMGLVGYSKQRNIFGVHPLVISTIYIIVTLFLASVTRKLVNALTSEGIVRRILLEFVATIELCATCFELIVVADNWGVWTYAVYLFLLTLWWSVNWGEATACPYSLLEEVLEHSLDISEAALLIFSQITAALVTFRYVQILWAMELVETHRDKAFEDCVADLQVHMVAGALIEGSATCLCRLTSKIVAEVNPRHGQVLDAFFGTMLVVAAFNLSGGYFNPALATSLKLGCQGNTFVEHLVVYWLGAIVGSAISVALFRWQPIRNYVTEIKAKLD